jgi:hypothetical protein
LNSPCHKKKAIKNRGGPAIFLGHFVKTTSAYFEPGQQCRRFVLERLRVKKKSGRSGKDSTGFPWFLYLTQEAVGHGHAPSSFTGGLGWPIIDPLGWLGLSILPSAMSM